ncbi:hypothetical protein KVT40_004851 [Elsinoe batatas]|uniref:Transcription factor Iwr1 domain-containing protein n=1 Tax=Elsinoe batatas TaxID=2601811 RepID=A0A8K0L7X5_9PEZI|nr:hypothetical protein KVT40_004851 [Elsinoe batatas]
MTAAPSYVAVKRKRDDAPIQSLILEERRTKHARVNVEYKLKSVSQASNEQPPKPTEVTAPPAQDKDKGDGAATATNTPSKSPFVKKTDTLAHKAIKNSGPRHFELATGKRSADTAGLLPTFIERPLKRSNVELDSPPVQKTTPLKRPGTKSTQKNASNASSDLKALGRTEPSAALSAKLSALAFEESGEAAPKPRVAVQPRPTPRRRREPAPAAPPASDDDYVYDIYIRSAATPSLPPAPTTPSFHSIPSPTTHTPLPLPTDSTAPRSLTSLPTSLASFSPTHSDPDVGYLILPDSSESSYFWSSDPLATKPTAHSDTSDEGDDEDSNAEGFYANEYPDDEVDGEDEMGRGAYGFRHGRGSEDEDEYGDDGWGGRGGGSDEDSDEDAAGENPWKKFMGRERRRMEEEDEFGRGGGGHSD